MKDIIGERLSIILEERGITQQKVADYLRVTHNTMSYYCCGKRKPSLLHLVEISNFLGCSVDYLLGKDIFPDKKTDQTNVSEYLGLDIRSIEILRKFSENGNSKKANLLIHNIDHILAFVSIVQDEFGQF